MFVRNFAKCRWFLNLVDRDEQQEISLVASRRTNFDLSEMEGLPNAIGAGCMFACGDRE